MEPSRDTLVDLLDLQRLDSTIDRLDYRRRNLPEQVELDSLNSRLLAIERVLGEHQLRADDCAARQRRLDGEIESITQKIHMEEARLFEGKVSSPKELSALQAEIDYLKKRKAAAEDEDLEVMEEREQQDKAIQNLQQEQKQLLSAVENQTRLRDGALTGILSEVEAARQQREAKSQKFDAELLQMYDDLRSSKAGVAIAPLVDGTCQGCHMKLPAQQVAHLRRAEGPARCVECGRLLVVG